MSINKKIHYCWFGRGNKSEIIKKCIESWRRVLPDYEIIEWNEDNFDVNICKYSKEAYDEEKYAFVSDFARFYILYNYGGIYMDVDVEVLKPLDIFLENKAFTGFETKDFVAPGLILGAEKGNTLIKEIMDIYLKKEFILSDGSYNLKTVVMYTTDILLKYGLNPNNSFQIINGMAIYPNSYFCPLNYRNNKLELTKNTYTIHHYAGTWLTEKQKRRNKSIIWKYAYQIKKQLIKLYSKSLSDLIKNYKSKIRRIIK